MFSGDVNKSTLTRRDRIHLIAHILMRLVFDQNQTTDVKNTYTQIKYVVDLYDFEHQSNGDLNYIRQSIYDQKRPAESLTLEFI